MSPFLLIAKLGPAVDCAPDALARSDPEGTRSALCLQIAQMPPASISYDGVFWQAPVYAAWTAPDYAERGAAWRELAIDTVRHRPLAAARVLMRDAVALVIHPNLEALPTQPPTDWAAYVVARSALPRYAPEPPRRFAAVLPVGNEAQSRLRGAILVVIACAIALSLRHRSRQRTSAIAMLLAWFGAVAFLLLVVPPQARYLATLDPLLGAAAVLAVATLRPRPRQAATSPVSSISAAS